MRRGLTAIGCGIGRSVDGRFLPGSGSTSSVRRIIRCRLPGSISGARVPEHRNQFLPVDLTRHQYRSADQEENNDQVDQLSADSLERPPLESPAQFIVILQRGTALRTVELPAGDLCLAFRTNHLRISSPVRITRVQFLKGGESAVGERYHHSGDAFHGIVRRPKIIA